MPKQRLAKLTRAALVQLTLTLLLTLGLTSAILYLTVWTKPPVTQAEPFYTELPGVNMDGLSPGEKTALLKRFNRQLCPCDCSRTVASCRNHHGSCSMSLAEARAAVDAAHKH